MAMTGKLTLTRTHGQNESILLARAISRAAALYGFRNSCFRSEVLTAPDWTVSPPVSLTSLSISDEMGDDEKDTR